MIHDSIVPGTARVVVTESTYITVRCGKCAACFETHISFRTARCKNRGRVCRLGQAAEAAPNVIPIRRRAWPRSPHSAEPTTAAPSSAWPRTLNHSVNQDQGG